MKYLKIENNKGFYWDGKIYKEIDKINKDDLFSLLNLAETDNFEIDPYNESSLGNRAHQIIYENIYIKFQEFLKDKDQFKKEVDKLYKEALSKYSVEIKDEDIDNDENFESEDNKAIDDTDDLPF